MQTPGQVECKWVVKSMQLRNDLSASIKEVDGSELILRCCLPWGGRMCVEWVAGSPWNRWPDVHGIDGRMAVESAEGLQDQQKVLKKLGFVDTTADALFPLYGRWSSPDGVIVRITSALTERKGCIDGARHSPSGPAMIFGFQSFGIRGTTTTVVARRVLSNQWYGHLRLTVSVSTWATRSPLRGRGETTSWRRAHENPVIGD
jgi:hypothetical protein